MYEIAIQINEVDIYDLDYFFYHFRTGEKCLASLRRRSKHVGGTNTKSHYFFTAPLFSNPFWEEKPICFLFDSIVSSGAISMSLCFSFIQALPCGEDSQNWLWNGIVNILINQFWQHLLVFWLAWPGKAYSPNV